MNLLNSLEESYLFNPPQNGHYVNYCEKITDEDKEEIKNLLLEFSNSKRQYGFSKTKNVSFIRMLKIEYFQKGGMACLPIYLTLGENGIEEIPDPKYKNKWDDYYEKMNCSIYKRLTIISFHSILNDGKIIEFTFDEHKLYQDSIIENMNIFQTTNSILLQSVLDKELNKNQKNTKKY